MQSGARPYTYIRSGKEHSKSLTKGIIDLEINEWEKVPINSQIHSIDLESNKLRGRKHSEFHSNDLEFNKNPLTKLSNPHN